MKGPIYTRIVLKTSGEILAGSERVGIDPSTLEALARQLVVVSDLGVETTVVIGGGNLVRGASAADRGVDRVTGDNMGMIATVINALALQDRLENLGKATRVMSALEMPEVCERFIRRRAERHLEKGRIVIAAAGTGNPYFTTDTAAALRAIELGADVLLKGTKVDGVYSADPVRDPNAIRHQKLTYRRVLDEGLQVMDSTAVALCMENNLPIVVFKITEPDSLRRVVLGEAVCTVVGSERVTRVGFSES